MDTKFDVCSAESHWVRTGKLSILTNERAVLSMINQWEAKKLLDGLFLVRVCSGTKDKLPPTLGFIIVIRTTTSASSFLQTGINFNLLQEKVVTFCTFSDYCEGRPVSISSNNTIVHNQLNHPELRSYTTCKFGCCLFWK